MGSATAVEYEIEVVLESQDTGICWRLRTNVGNINAVNAPTFAPVTNITEVSPITVTDIDIASLSNVMNSGVTFS